MIQGATRRPIGWLSASDNTPANHPPLTRRALKRDELKAAPQSCVLSACSIQTESDFGRPFPGGHAYECDVGSTFRHGAWYVRLAR
jgi:hypothetical protein